jgi:hypothetical protein
VHHEEDGLRADVDHASNEGNGDGSQVDSQENEQMGNGKMLADSDCEKDGSDVDGGSDLSFNMVEDDVAGGCDRVCSIASAALLPLPLLTIGTRYSIRKTNLHVISAALMNYLTLLGHRMESTRNLLKDLT